LDNHLAGVLFLTFIQPDLRLSKSGNVELPVDKQQRIASCLWAQVGFSRADDPATCDFHDATVLRKFGDVPDDLSAL